jgi:Tfp pilus assembly protein PilV
MCKYSYLLSVLFVGIGIVSISAPSQARIVDTTQTNAEAATEIQRQAQQNAENARRRSAQKKNHNYVQATNLAVSAADACYINKNLQECDKLNQIKNNLMNWCGQSDSTKSNACETYRFVLNYENAQQAYSNFRGNRWLLRL